jgi:AraC-like DNA-binding protein
VPGTHVPGTMSIVALTDAFRLAAASNLLLVAALLLRDHRRSRVTAGTTLLVACVVCYLTLPLLVASGAPRLALLVARAGALAVPFAFWLAARLFFEDDFHATKAHVGLLLAALALRALVVPWRVVASAVALVAVIDALRRILAGRSSDLLLSRLRLRSAVLLGTGIYAVLVLVGEAVLRRGSRVEIVLDGANDLGLFLLTGSIAMLLMRIDPDLVKEAPKRPVSAAPPTLLEKRLERLIEEEQVYKTEGLTIGTLAERLGEAEYKVRQLINAHLGFRNFGAFLNHYRVREARKVLADPAQKGLGVAEIAYRFGYASLGPFNRAFKEIVGQTPTEYRKAATEREILADSEIGEASSKRS